jgi:hypothetical protein
VRHRERQRRGRLRREGGTADPWEYGDLVTGKLPDAVARFVAAFVREFEQEQVRRRP